MNNPTAQNQPDPTDASPAQPVARRTLVHGAAWTVPIVATALMSPAASASTPVQTCPTLSVYYGASAATRVFNLRQNGTWNPGVSSGTVTIGFGDAVNGSFPALSYATPAVGQVTVDTLTYAVVYYLPVGVNWTTIPAGWVLESSTFSGGQWQYRFRYTPTPTSTVVTAGSTPGTTTIPTSTASGTIIGSTVPTNWRPTTWTQFSVYLDGTYAPHFVAAPGCTSTDGNDGVVRLRQGLRTLSVTVVAS